MINSEFCERVLAMIGQSYSQTDCIGVVRKAANIRCQGTNWLWRSYRSSGKYKYLIQRMERAPTENEIKNGLLVFRIQWHKVPQGYDDTPNCHHVGVIVDDCVIQSTEKLGVHRRPYIVDEWDGCGWLKFVDFPLPSPDADADPDEDPADDVPFVPDPAELSDHDMLLALYNHFIRD